MRGALLVPFALVAVLPLSMGCTSSGTSPDESKDTGLATTGDAATDTRSTPADAAVDGVSDASRDTDLAGDVAVKDDWDNYAQGFFAKYCVECHADAKRDYRTFGDVARDSSLIACGVAPSRLAACGAFPPPRQFPIDDATGTNPKPTDDERRRLVAWIESP